MYAALAVGVGLLWALVLESRRAAAIFDYAVAWVLAVPIWLALTLLDWFCGEP